MPNGLSTKTFSHNVHLPLSLLTLSALGFLSLSAGCGGGSHTISSVPAANKIAFVSSTWEDSGPLKTSGLYTMNVDGSDIKKVVDGGDSGLNWASFSPDGNKIVFGTIGSSIYTMNADGTNKKQVYAGAAASVYPTWSPDGTKIAFISTNFRLPPSIVVVDADGENPKILSDDSSSETWPSFSPDGKKIAFASGRDGSVPYGDGFTNTDIYVMDTDGKNIKRLTNTKTALMNYPSFSPDGNKIIFVSTSNVNGNTKGIYSMNSDGSNLTLIKENSGTTTAPRYSPDGSKIVFASDRDGDSEIYIMDANGTNLKKLTSNTNFDGTPSWYN
jgi:Tol biopolymer transport system component